MSKEKRIWDSCKPIGEIMKSERTKLKVELVARDGVKYINIRGWYMRKKDEQWMPGMDGIAVPLEIPIDGEKISVDLELAALLEKARSMSVDFKIEDPETAVYAKPKD